MSVYGLENIEEGISHEIDNPERRDIGKKISGLRAKKNKMSEQILKHQKEGDNKKLPELKRKHIGLECRINNQIRKSRFSNAAWLFQAAYAERLRLKL